MLKPVRPYLNYDGRVFGDAAFKARRHGTEDEPSCLGLSVTDALLETTPVTKSAANLKAVFLASQGQSSSKSIMTQKQSHPFTTNRGDSKPRSLRDHFICSSFSRHYYAALTIGAGIHERNHMSPSLFRAGGTTLQRLVYPILAYEIFTLCRTIIDLDYESGRILPITADDVLLMNSLLRFLIITQLTLVNYISPPFYFLTLCCIDAFTSRRAYPTLAFRITEKGRGEERWYIYCFDARDESRIFLVIIPKVINSALSLIESVATKSIHTIR